MSEWISILAGLLGSTTLAGAASAFYFRRETKRIKKAEINKESAAAMKEDATAAKEMLELVVEMKTVLLGFNETLKITLEDRDETIRQKDNRIDELEKKLKELEYISSVQDRRIKGMQKVIENNLNAIKNAGIYMSDENWKECQKYLEDV